MASEWDVVSQTPVKGGWEVVSHTPTPPKTNEALAAEAAANQVPNTVMPHTGTINPGRLPTTDEARAAVQKWDVPEGPSIMGMMKSTLLGAMDIGQGRVLMNNSGNPLSIRLTPESMDALGMAASMSPAVKTPVPRLSAGARVVDDGAPPASFGQVASAAPGSFPARLAAALSGSEQRSVGAAGTPFVKTAMGTREAAASRATGERLQLMETARPGDTTEYVPGVKPTLAEIKQNAAVSREAKTLRIENPEAISARELANAEHYADFYADMAGTPTIVNRAKEVRGEQAEIDLKAAWKDKMKADIQPVLDVAKAIEASPDGRRPLVRSEISKVTKELYDDAGKAITDPEQLYGVRKHLNDLLSKEAQRENPASVRAEATLLALKQSLDDVIEAAAPGFKKYLTNFEAESRPIDAMTTLQEAMPALFQGANRAVAFHRFDRFMRDLASDRAAKGVNPAKSIDDATWEKLVAMHKSLQRTAGAELQARAPGSDTATTVYDMSKLGIRAAAHAVGAVVMPGLGNVAAHLGSNYLDKKAAAARLAKHLDPDLTKIPHYDNPLALRLTNHGFKSDFPNNQTGP